MILLIVPGVIFALMFMFATMIVIDRGLGPIESMKESRRITTGYKWKLLGLALVLTLLNLAPDFSRWWSELLVTVPVTVLAFTRAYRELSARAGVPAATLAIADACI